MKLEIQENKIIKDGIVYILGNTILNGQKSL